MLLCIPFTQSINLAGTPARDEIVSRISSLFCGTPAGLILTITVFSDPELVSLHSVSYNIINAINFLSGYSPNAFFCKLFPSDKNIIHVSIGSLGF
jgi:hypothetical protein